jgi:hypothetical protein
MHWPPISHCPHAQSARARIFLRSAPQARSGRPARILQNFWRRMRLSSSPVDVWPASQSRGAVSIHLRRRRSPPTSSSRRRSDARTERTRPLNSSPTPGFALRAAACPPEGRVRLRPLRTMVAPRQGSVRMKMRSMMLLLTALSATLCKVGQYRPSARAHARTRARAHASTLYSGAPDPQASVSCVDSCHAWIRLAEPSTPYSASTPTSATKRWQSMNEVLCRHCARRCSLRQPLLNIVQTLINGHELCVMRVHETGIRVMPILDQTPRP